jgi:site-specific DNA recombinase
MPEKDYGQAVNEGPERCTFYGRYSSSRQKRASITDQFRNCREGAEEKGWAVVEECIRSDEEKSGTSLFGRQGLQDLLAFAKQKPRPFDVLVIDETSRFGRNIGDVFKLLDIFEHHGVRLYFVSDDLESGNEWFRDAFAAKARADEQFSRTHGKRVRRGRVGRFDAGFNPGGGCYGYRNEKVFDHTKKGEHGEPGIMGMRQVIDPEQEKVVLRIFNSYAAGMSYMDIVRLLNGQEVPPPQSTRKNITPSWSKHAVECILSNDRYRGKITYGRTIEAQDPETGKKKRRKRPVSEWRTREDPELRIVPEELFAKVHELRKVRTGKIGIQRTGGLNRTEASRQYLFSGSLTCGLCGGSMSIRVTNPARYGCVNHQYRGTCSNRSTVRQDHLEQTLLHALSERVRSADVREELVQMLTDYLGSQKTKRLASQKSAKEQRTELMARRKRQLLYQENLVKAVRESGGSQALYTDLTRVAAKIARIDEILQCTVVQPVRDVAPKEVRGFVNERLQAFEAFLSGNRTALRNHFQQRLGKIMLTPSIDEHGPLYLVTGDVDLFSSPESVVQTNQVHLIGLHHTFPIACEIRPYRNRQRWAEAASASGDPTWASISAGEPLARAGA